MDYEAKVLKSARTFLDRWVGSRARLHELTSSHKSLQILLTTPDRQGSLLICCLGPVRIRGPIDWEGSAIRIEACPRNQAGLGGFVVSDTKAGLEIQCEAIEVKENVKL